MNRNYFKFIVLTILGLGIVFALLKFMPERFPNAKLDNQSISQIVVSVLILLNILYNASKKGNKAALVKSFLIWQGVFIIIILGYAFRFELGYATQRLVSAIIPSYKIISTPGKITIARNADNHFYLTALVNDQEIMFMIDTGATSVALTKEDAIKLGFNLKKLDFDRTIYTANGPSKSAYVKIEKFAIGPKVLDNIGANINSGELDVSLLGMSVLKQFKSFRISNDLLILEY